jgi:hypothetical protein
MAAVRKGELEFMDVDMFRFTKIVQPRLYGCPRCERSAFGKRGGVLEAVAETRMKLARLHRAGELGLWLG